MPKKILKQLALTLIENNLKKYFNVSWNHATNEQIFKALSAVTMDELFEIRGKSKKPQNTKGGAKKPMKALHYLTIEILLGKTLKNTLFNLGWESVFTGALKTKGIDINSIYAIEVDAGLGNGGLGRLAACFMDSLATLNYPAVAHCIKYDYGLFKQRIIDSQQVEFLDDWLANGSVWLTARPDEAVTVRFFGNIRSYKGKDGKLKFEYDDAQEVEAIPYDMMLSGYESKVVSNLKLWSAKSKKQGDIHLSRMDFAQRSRESQDIENINSVLYPSNDHAQGKTLRLKQQYFLCSASLQSIIHKHLRKGYNLRDLPQFVAVHINDTHPAWAVPELMRILMDENSLSWDDSWDIVTKCISYTNHTILQEALEVWSVEKIQRLIPRIYQIICEIDRRLRDTLARKKKFASEVDSMAILAYGNVRMSNLAIWGSHKVNGVAKLHSDILKDKTFKNFAEYLPDRFINITNGVTHRRWLAENNQQLTEFITAQIGEKFLTEAGSLKELCKCLEDSATLRKINQIKLNNKKEFAKWLLEYQGIQINPESRFDVHVKRIHEYKRQLMNILRVISIYNILQVNPDADVTPQTFIFAGKAASSYFIAKRIIKLICQVATEIDKNPKINKKIKVVFVENFSVSVSEKLIPATEVSQQISLAGYEASGTGNMKAVMNGALMLCTYDGAQPEIDHHCGEGGNFMFGLSPAEVERTWADGYHPIDLYHSNPIIMGVIDALNTGFNGECFRDIASYLLCTSAQVDNYMCLADFEEYLRAHERMDALYRKPLEWARASLRNISNMGHFSSDRSIEEYVEHIWDLTKLK